VTMTWPGNIASHVASTALNLRNQKRVDDVAGNICQAEERVENENTDSTNVRRLNFSCPTQSMRLR
jgi:hypothetical protein